MREAQALARLNHPNVVAIYDVATVGDNVFLAMERIAGVTLTVWLRQQPRGWREVQTVFLAAGRGLAAAHAVGILHRDFKPSNVMVGGGRVVVLDFGLARASDDVDTPGKPAPASLDLDLTGTGDVVGTPAYMAPEHLAGGPATAKGDQWSFCVALYEALYGARPFPGARIESLLELTRRGPPTPPRRAVPRWLTRLVLRGATAPAPRGSPPRQSPRSGRRGPRRMRGSSRPGELGRSARRRVHRCTRPGARLSATQRRVVLEVGAPPGRVAVLASRPASEDTR